MNVFVITSPFQYLCANEARIFYKSKNNILVYVEQEAERGKKNMAEILDESLWDKIIKIPRTQRTFRIPSVIKKLKRMSSNIERIFLSEYHGWRSNLFMKNFPNTDVVYFDDGSATLVEHEELIKPQKPYIRRRIINDTLIKMQGLKPANYVPYRDNFEIFSVFSLENENCIIRKNKMTGLRNMLNSQACYEPSSNIGFIGEANINARPDCIQLEDYISELENILSTTDKNITYFPHRMETQMVRDRVSSLDRVQYHDSRFPIELEIAKSKVKLSQLIGYSSTALYTLSIIYNEIPIKILEPNNMASCQVALETNEIIKNQFRK